MFQYYLFFSLICFVYAYEPSCTNCRYFIPNKLKPDLGLCNMFQDTIYHNNGEKLVKNLAIHCRGNENLCGKSGFLFEPIQNSKLVDKYEYIQSLSCGEFIDQKDLDELEEIERDLMDVFQKMRKHNTKMMYKTPREIYKLFKRNTKNEKHDS